MKKYIFPLITILTILSLEIFSRTTLFSYVSYFNYDAIDWQMSDLSLEPKVDVIFLGSSEVRYGMDPEQFVEAVGGNTNGLSAFNLGIDGMNLSFYKILLPYLYPRFSNKGVAYAVVGVNLAEDVVTFPASPEGQINCREVLGDLQRGVFQSPFGEDSGLNQVCALDKGKWWIEELGERYLASFRYRKYLRKWLLSPNQRKFSREELNLTRKGFHVRPHAESSIALDDEFAKWWDDEGKKAGKLDAGLFDSAFQTGGIYFEIASFLKKHKIVPVFVALPTNPRMIDMLERREIYQERSRKFAAWAKEDDNLYFDFEIKDTYDPVLDFADRRHLSSLGAKKFSAELGEALKPYLVSEK